MASTSTSNRYQEPFLPISRKSCQANPRPDLAGAGVAGVLLLLSVSASSGLDRSREEKTSADATTVSKNSHFRFKNGSGQRSGFFSRVPFFLASWKPEKHHFWRIKKETKKQDETFVVEVTTRSLTSLQRRRDVDNFDIDNHQQ